MPARLKFRSVRTKLLAASLAMGIIPVGVVGVLAYQRASQSLTRDAGDASGPIAFQVADKGLIRESSQSGASLQEIVSSVKRVTDMVGEIAAASREQTIGIEEVNRAVSQMDQARHVAGVAPLNRRPAASRPQREPRPSRHLVPAMAVVTDDDNDGFTDF